MGGFANDKNASADLNSHENNAQAIEKHQVTPTQDHPPTHILERIIASSRFDLHQIFSPRVA
jgi:hypothetical protein